MTFSTISKLKSTFPFPSLINRSHHQSVNETIDNPKIFTFQKQVGDKLVFTNSKNESIEKSVLDFQVKRTTTSNSQNRDSAFHLL